MINSLHLSQMALLPWNTVSMHIVPFRSSNVKQNRLEELNKIFEKRTEIEQMFQAVGVIWAHSGVIR